MHYQRVAKAFGAEFLDAASIVTASNADGIHLDVTENKKLGSAVAEKVSTIV